MKKAIIIVVVLGALIALYMTTNSSTEVTQNPNSVTEEGSINPDPSNATFTFSDGPVTLSGGEATKDVPGSAFLTEETSLTDLRAYGELNGDQKTDTAVILTRTGGGSGSFIYVASFLSTSGSYKGSNAVFLGDRIIPQDISINDSIVTVNYLDRAEGEPFAAEPTVPSSKQFRVSSGILEEI
ncbi:MAG: hypothetical protein WDZ61_00875 [Parcubacteria group bacterium]